MGLKTPWFQMLDRLKDSLELEAESIWNRNGFKDSLVSNAEYIQRHFWNWKRNRFGIGMGLKTAWFHMWDRFKDSLELEVESIWNQNGFKDSLVSYVG